MDRHLKAHRELYQHLVNGEAEKAKATKDFYDEYFAVLDLTAEFFLETVRLVFQEHALALGTLTWRGNKIEPRAIRRTMLLTVEGERDDICAVGQTVAAQELCTSLRPISSAITCSSASGTTASSAAGAGGAGVSAGQERDPGERLKPMAARP